MQVWRIFRAFHREATSNKCLASSNKCLTGSNKKLLGTSALLVVTIRWEDTYDDYEKKATGVPDVSALEFFAARLGNGGLNRNGDAVIQQSDPKRPFSAAKASYLFLSKPELSRSLCLNSFDTKDPWPNSVPFSVHCGIHCSWWLSFDMQLSPEELSAQTKERPVFC